MNLDETTRFRERLYALALKMLKDHERAQDAVQNTYLKALTGSFREESNLYTWMHRIAVNVCLDAMRGEGRRPRSVEDFESHLETVEDDRVPPLDALLDMKKDIEALTAALNSVNPNHKVLLLKAFSGDIVFSEMAKELGINESSARVKVMRDKKKAVEAVRREMEKSRKAA